MKLERAVHIKEPLGADGSGPWAPCLDEVARIRQNVRAILGVMPREWPMRSDRGTPLAAAIYETNDTLTQRMFATIIKTQLSRFEPYLKVARVTVETPTVDAITITIYGLAIRTGEFLEVPLTLRRSA